MRKHLMLCIFIVCSFGKAAGKDADVVGDFLYRIKATIRIIGTAKGGEVSLILPDITIAAGKKKPLHLPHSITIKTQEGETANQVAAKLKEKVKVDLDNYVFVQGNENIFEIWEFHDGEIGLKSTDSGILSMPKIEGVKAETTNDGVELSWSLPAGIDFDEIRVLRGRTRFPAISAKQTTFKDNLFSLGSREKNLIYRVVGFKDGVPSESITVSVERPIVKIQK